MAQLILTAASSVGSAVARAGVGQFIARTVATTAAAYAAGYADRLIFGPRKRTVEGPRLEGLTLQASQEGAPIPRVFGRARIAGQVIWAANFKETTSDTTESAGGKGGRPASQTTFTEYLYSISFAVGLCEGQIDRVGRIWADGKPFDVSQHNVRVYRGDEDQQPDMVIESVEGAGNAPAYRGLSYIVFEDLPLKDFGNRIPQLSFEIEKSLAEEDPGALENALTAVTLIPGSGEFVYGTTKVLREEGEGVTVPENVHNHTGATDFTASMDALTASAPRVKHASLVVSWFGNSTDAGACALRPGVDSDVKTTLPYDWKAGGVDRGGAHLISTIDGAPAYGGTPADRSVVEAITSLKSRGISVMMHPFILMDAPGFPWRGRIGVGANDKTATAGADIASFFGTASASDFSIMDDEVNYNGPAEWSFRRMILHFAHLSVLAGGVDAFLLGSELRAITTARDSASTYPAVAAMKALAAEVRIVLGPATEISYGADWSEYFGHQPPDGSSDVFFHLDELWADPAIDFIGIDNYMPIADWRDGFAHLDALAGAPSQYDPAYLRSNIAGGEGYDWFYASQADRDGQVRSPITDSAHGESWIYRYKDLKNWWLNDHHNRPGGVRDASPTSWVPQSKPFRFTEAGAPAVDKAANQPNVFVDAKSSESALPYYSTGRRDDRAQRSVIEAQFAFWNAAENNPVSSVYGAPMVAADHQYVYAYDARPFPDFPARTDVWGDGPNWARGHWLNGRLGRAPLDLLVHALAREAGFEAVDASGLNGVITGYLIDRPLSVREMIDPLADVFQFDVIESANMLRFQSRAAVTVLNLETSNLSERSDGAFSLTLGQESDLPVAFRLGFFDEGEDFATAVTEARDPAARPARESGIDIAAVIPAAEAEARARSILADAWVMRERLSFSLPPSRQAIEPGDAITINDLGADKLYRVLDIEDGTERRVDAVRVSREVYNAPLSETQFSLPAAVDVPAPLIWELFELPLLADADPSAPWFAAYGNPWPGAAALYRGTENPVLSGVAPARAVMGRLTSALSPAGSGRWSQAHIDVSLSFGTLSSREEEEVFSGANLFAVQSANGAWELAQFRDAVLLPDGTWRLTGLLRGQGGSENEALAGAEIGARFVLVNRALGQVSFSTDLRDLDFDWQAGPERDIPGTENFTGKTLRFAGRALKPLSPVHLRARAEGGDIRLSWIRRTREGGDSWQGEVPLAELSERYRVRIYDGGTVLREIETTQTDYLYDAADIVADFGADGPGASLTFGAAQLSDVVGEGVEGKGEKALFG